LAFAAIEGATLEFAEILSDELSSAPRAVTLVMHEPMFSEDIGLLPFKKVKAIVPDFPNHLIQLSR
jgi:hypothetical protein